MTHLLLQRLIKTAAFSVSAFTAFSFVALPGYSQNVHTFGSGSFHTNRQFNHEFDRSIRSSQRLGSDIVCSSDIDRSRFFRPYRRHFSSSVLTNDLLINDPLVPNRLSNQPMSSQLAPTLINDPLVPNRLSNQPFNSDLSQTRHTIRDNTRQVVACQTIKESSITMINQPLSNHFVNITINNGGFQSAQSVASRRSANSSELPPGAIAYLPDGNYRITSATNVASDISNEALVSHGGRLFTFNKSGNSIIGNFDDFDGGFSACVTGSVNGSTITGQAFTDDLGTDVLGRSYLDLGLALELGDQVSRDRYDNSVLNLSGFSRINAGTALPPTRC